MMCVCMSMAQALEGGSGSNAVHHTLCATSFSLADCRMSRSKRDWASRKRGSENLPVTTKNTLSEDDKKFKNVGLNK